MYGCISPSALVHPQNLPLPPRSSSPPLRSFQGFTCLIQISGRSHDYVVDAIALRAFLGPALRPLLTDPSRVKVLHGADRDVEWLQVCVCVCVAGGSPEGGQGLGAEIGMFPGR